MSKRPRLEVVKRLNFEPNMEELLYPDSPPGDITPPPSPEVFPEMLNVGPSDAGADRGTIQALPSPRNPVLRRPPVLEDYINVTSTGGERAFLVLRADLTGTGVQVCDHSVGLAIALVPLCCQWAFSSFQCQFHRSKSLEIGTPV